MPTPTCFGIKVPSSGSLSTTKVRTSNTRFRQRTFVVDKLPDDGTLVPKHVCVGTRYEVCLCSVFYVNWGILLVF